MSSSSRCVNVKVSLQGCREVRKDCDPRIDSGWLLDNITCEKEAINFLTNKGILHKQRICSSGHKMAMTKTAMWICQCGKEIPLCDGTWFEDTIFPLGKAIFLLYHWSMNIDIGTLQFNLQISKGTCAEWYDKIRGVSGVALMKNPSAVGGPGCKVDIELCLFYERKKKSFTERRIFGGICRETQKCFLTEIREPVSSSTIANIIEKYIYPHTKIICEAWNVYLSDEDMTQLKYNHRVEFINEVTRDSRWEKEKLLDQNVWGDYSKNMNPFVCEFMWHNLKFCRPFEAILEEIATYLSDMIT